MSKVGGSDSKNTLYCSFCGKSQHEVCMLVPGPKDFICDECVSLCVDIFREENRSALTRTRSDAPAATGPVLHCSFCTKSQHEVSKLIAGPTVFICDECVDAGAQTLRSAGVGRARRRFLDHLRNWFPRRADSGNAQLVGVLK
jgi:ATP-dependent protease Clp ATPase subunit